MEQGRRHLLSRAAGLLGAPALLAALAVGACGAPGGTEMRIEVATEGGLAHFPGLARPTVIEGDQLTEEDRAEFRRLIEASRFFDLPSEIGAPARGAADYRRYTITIRDGPREHTIRLTEPIPDPDLQRLLGVVRAKARQVRAGSPPSPE